MKSNFVIACVYKKSSAFPFDYVRAFANVFGKYHPKKKLVVFSDYNEEPYPPGVIRIPLKYNWSNGWWTKLELFRPDIEENLFFTDLDNLILKPLDQFFESFSEDMPLMIQDLDKNQKRLQSAVMWIPHSKKQIVWDKFMLSPDDQIKNVGKFGDAAIIRSYWNKEKKTCDTFQDVFGKGKIISYRYHWKKGISQNDAHVVCFHGERCKPHLVPKSPLTINHWHTYT